MTKQELVEINGGGHRLVMAQKVDEFTILALRIEKYMLKYYQCTNVDEIANSLRLLNNTNYCYLLGLDGPDLHDLVVFITSNTTTPVGLSIEEFRKQRECVS